MKQAVKECVIAVIDIEIFRYFQGQADILTDTVTRNVAFSLLHSLSSSVPILSWVQNIYFWFDLIFCFLFYDLVHFFASLFHFLRHLRTSIFFSLFLSYYFLTPQLFHYLIRFLSSSLVYSFIPPLLLPPLIYFSSLSLHAFLNSLLPLTLPPSLPLTLHPLPYTSQWSRTIRLDVSSIPSDLWHTHSRIDHIFCRSISN